MTEYGIFNDEGCLESGFYSEREAQIRLAVHYFAETGAYVEEVCPDHEEQPRHACEQCQDADEVDA